MLFFLSGRRNAATGPYSSVILRHILTTWRIVLTSRVNRAVLFAEFSDNTESIILSPERLAIIEDFNIHVDAPRDLDARKLLPISWALATCL